MIGSITQIALVLANGCRSIRNFERALEKGVNVMTEDPIFLGSVTISS